MTIKGELWCSQCKWPFNGSFHVITDRIARHWIKNVLLRALISYYNDDVIKWKNFPRYWSFVNSPHKGQWGGALMFSLICTWTNRVNNRDVCHLRRHRAYYDVIMMDKTITMLNDARCQLKLKTSLEFIWHAHRNGKRGSIVILQICHNFPSKRDTWPLRNKLVQWS